MPRLLALSLTLLATAGSGLTVAGQSAPPAEPAIPAVVAAATAGAESQPALPALSTLRRVQLLPTVVPRLEFTVERTPFFRRDYLPLGTLWNGRVRVGCFRHSRETTFLIVPAASKGDLVVRRELSYGIHLSINFWARTGAEETGR